uniref:Uncharacterized protein n=1 Tax=Trichobilharzia regenti TaxID=157069 RepID=A0AA85JUJ7_TRIRE|nr:unnamed protein product [Trichobilharzia regenti]
MEQSFRYLSVIGPEHWRFLICQFLSLLSGYAMRKCIPPCIENSKRRHFFEFISGLIILYIGYGSLVIHMFAQALPAYLMMVFLPLSIAQYGILIFSMMYLSGVHIHKFVRNPSIDITAPLMVQTQKLSSLAFNINDGVKLAKEGVVDRDYHRLNAVERRPRLLQLGGYLFSFHNVMIGPFNFFADYLRFIQGQESERLMDESDKKLFEENKEEIRLAKAEKWKQVKLLLLHTILTIWALSSFKPEYFLSDDFAKKNYLQKYIYLSIACFGFRQRFYFAWTVNHLYVSCIHLRKAFVLIFLTTNIGNINIDISYCSPILNNSQFSPHIDRKQRQVFKRILEHCPAWLVRGEKKNSSSSIVEHLVNSRR